MHRIFVKPGLIALAITTGLIAPSLAQDLRMAIWSANEAHLVLFNGIADEFESSHPGVTVTFDSLAYDGYTTTLTTQIAGGNAPDLAWILDSTALGCLVSGRRKAVEAGGSFVVLADSAPLVKLFAITKLDHVFEILPDREAWLSSRVD